jgi:hypothetical protein
MQIGWGSVAGDLSPCAGHSVQAAGCRGLEGISVAENTGAGWAMPTPMIHFHLFNLHMLSMLPSSFVRCQGDRGVFQSIFLFVCLFLTTLGSREHQVLMGSAISTLLVFNGCLKRSLPYNKLLMNLWESVLYVWVYRVCFPEIVAIKLSEAK